VLDRLLPVSPLRLWRPKTVSVERLTEQVDAILRAWGMSVEHAEITAELIVYADAHGIDSHGCSMLPGYHRDLRDGVLDMTPNIEVVRESDTTGLVDGGGGLGHLPARTAMELAISKCRVSGVGAVGVRNSGHYGAAGAYAEMAVREGLIGVATTNTRAAAVVPTFATEAVLGTNPLAFAAPAGRNPPFLLDMATSTVPVGRLIERWREGRAIPVGWALNPSGKPTRSARRAWHYRRMTPLGGSHEMGSHKGYGLAAMVEILTSVLPGEPFPRPRSKSPGGVGHFFVALDPARFRDVTDFQSDMDELIDTLHSSARSRPSRPVLVAGDPERTALAERSASGIPMSRSVFEDLRAIARTSKVDFVLGGAA
jgi:LDH2 family malate/lactate/ureidoglycolate dehydrogenase